MSFFALLYSHSLPLHPPSFPLAIMNQIFISRLLSLQGYYVNGIIEDVTFCDLFSTQLKSMEIHAGCCITNVFTLFFLNCVPWMDVAQFTLWVSVCHKQSYDKHLCIGLCEYLSFNFSGRQTEECGC